MYRQVRNRPGTGAYPRPAIHLMALEPRWMFDGAAVATATDAVAATDGGDRGADTPDTPPPLAADTTASSDIQPAAAPAERKEVAFVDSSVADYQTLVDGLRPGIEVVVIEQGQSGLDKMARWAETHSGYDAVHVLSHGSEGTLYLGRDVLGSPAVANNTVKSDFAAIGQALSAGGDLLVYGCDVAANDTGLRFIAELAAATGADVAASDDVTGADGNWTLEVAKGDIETTAIQVASYEGNLSLVGTNVAIWTDGFEVFSAVPVGAGVEFDLSDGLDLQRFDVNASTNTITITLNGSADWAVSDFTAVFSGGNLNEITSVFRTGGTAPDAASYSASVSGAKEITFTVPSSYSNGTVIFTYTSTAVGGDTTAPTVSSVSVPSNDTYATAQNLDFTVNFDENVTVNTGGGTPRLALDIGGTTKYATYQSGSGTSALVFRYTVESGLGDSNGIDVSALQTNGGTLKDAAGNDATLTLNSVGSTASVLVDAVAPTVSSVSVPSNDTYTTAENLDFTVNFDENVTVNTGGGTPRLALDIGGTTKYATYQSGSGTSALVFRYTVESGLGDSNGVDVSALQTNGGTLKDAAGNDATLTLNSVGSTASVLVDAVAQSSLSAGTYDFSGYAAPSTQSSDGTWTPPSGGTAYGFTFIVTGTGGTASEIKIQSASGNNYLNFQQAGGTTETATIKSADNGELKLTSLQWRNVTGASTATVTFTGYRDGASVGTTTATYNAENLFLDKSFGSLFENVDTVVITGLHANGIRVDNIVVAAAVVDTTAPTVSSVSVPSNDTYTTAENLDFTVNFDENVTVNTGGGTPRLALDIGGTTKYATYQSGSGTSALVFRYTVESGLGDSNGVDVSALQTNGGTLKDAAGNDATLTLNSVGSTASVLVDAVAPTVTSVSVPSNDTFITGENLDFTVNFDENVTVNTGGGTPRLALDIGGTTKYATYQSGSGTSALVFRYAVENGLGDSNGIDVSALQTNGGTLKDAAGNDATLTLNSVASTASVLVDSTNPTLSSNSPSDNSTGISSTANIVLNFSENVAKGTGNITIKKTSDNSTVETIDVTSGQVTVSGSQVTINPNSTLADSTEYYVLVDATAFDDSAGNAYAGISSTTALSFTTTATNDAPAVATPTAASYTDTAADDSFGNTTGTLSATDGDGTVAAYGITGGTTGGSTDIGGTVYDVSKAGTYGTLYVKSADGAYVFVPNATAINARSADASETFTVTATDDQGGEGSATLSVDITAANDTPTLSAPSGIDLTDSSAADSFANQTGTLSGADRDSGTTLTYGIDTPTSSSADFTADGITYDISKTGSYGTLYVKSTTGDYVYVATAAAIDALAAGSSESFTVSASDGALSATRTLTVTVTAANDTPSLGTATASYTDTAADDSFDNATGTLSATDADGVIAAYGITGGTTGGSTDIGGTVYDVSKAGSYGTLYVKSSTGAYAFVPDADAINGVTGNTSEAFTVTATDDGDATDTATFTVNITGANDAPAVATPTAASYTDTAADDSFGSTTGTLSATDGDGTIAAYGISGGTTGGSTDIGGTVYDVSKAGTYGTLYVKSADGAYVFVPNATAINARSADASETFTVTATDDQGGEGSATLSVDITAANDTPTLSGFTTAGTVDDDATTTPFANVVVDDADGDDVSVAITYTQADGTLSGTGLTGSAGAYTLSATDAATLQSRLRALAFTPTANQVAPGQTVVTSFNLTVNDGTDDGTSDGSTQVTATSVNDSPAITASGTPTEYTERTPIAAAPTITITDADTDADWDGATLTVQITGNNRAEDTLSLPTANPGGDGIWVDSDGSKLMAGITQIGTASAVSVSDDTAVSYTFNGNATDALVQAVAQSVLFDSSSYDPDTNQRTVTFTVDDGSGAVGDTQAVNVTATPDKPTVTGLASLATLTAFLENAIQATPAAAFSAGTVGDTDSTHFNGGYLLISGKAATDVLTVVAAGSITVSGDTVSYDGSVFGSLDAVLDGSAGADLRINFDTTNATPAAVTDLLQAIRFTVTSDQPTATRSLSVTVQDGSAADASDAATAVVNVTAENDQPGAIVDNDGTANTVAENSAIGTAVGITAGATDPDADTLAWSLTDDAGGRFAIDPATGVVTAAGALDYESATSHSITVQASDANGGTRSQTFTIAVSNVNEAPIAADDTGAATDAGADNATGNVIANDIDIENDALAILAFRTGATEGQGTAGTVGQPLAGTYGSLTLNADGSYTYAVDASNADVPALGSGDTLTEAFNYTVSDGNGGTDTATITITITGSNDAPTLAVNTGVMVKEGGTVTVDASTLTLSDPDTTVTELTYTLTSVPAHGTLYRSGDALAEGGTFTQADINGGIVDYIHDGSETTADSFSFTAADGVGGVLDETGVAISIVPQNDAPTTSMSSGSPTFLPGGGGVAVDSDLTLADVDSANLNQAIMTLTSRPDGSHESLSLSAAAQAAANSVGLTFTYDAAAGRLVISGVASLPDYEAVLRGVLYENAATMPDTTARTVSVTVRDTYGTSSIEASRTVLLDAPPILGSAAADQSLTDKATIQPFAAFTIDDQSPGQQQAVTVTLDDAAKGGFTVLAGFTESADGSYSFTGTADEAQAAIRQLVFAPTENRVAPGSTETTTFTVSVHDGANPAVTDATTTAVVTGVNDAPTAVGMPTGDKWGAAGGSLTIPETAFLDVDPDTSLAWSASGNPSWMQFDPVARTLSGTPPVGSVGSSVVTITVDDGHGGITSQTVTMSWDNPAPPPPPPPAPPPPPPPPPPPVNTGVTPVVTIVSPSAPPQALPATPTAPSLPPPPASSPAPSPATGAAAPSAAPAPDAGTRAASTAPGVPTAPTPASDGGGSFKVAVITSMGPAQGDALVAVKPVAVVESTGGQVNFTLPTDTFASTQADAVVQLVATQVDGTALPGWLAFNPQTGTFVGQPPPGLTGELVVRVIARDQDGREAIATVRINLAGGGDARPEGEGQGEGQAPQGQGQGQPQGDGQAPGRTGEAMPETGTPVVRLAEFGEVKVGGKPTFMEEFRMASRLSGARQAQLLAAARGVARQG